MKQKRREYASYILNNFRDNELPEDIYRDIMAWMSDLDNRDDLEIILKEYWDKLDYEETKRAYEAMATVREKLGMKAVEGDAGSRQAERLYREMSDPDINPGAKYYKENSSGKRAESPVSYKPKSRLKILGRIAAVVMPLLMIAGIALWYKAGKKADEFVPIVILTQAGEQKNVTLPDGTNVSLNENSTLTYNGHRSTVLSGQAYLKVHKDAGAPFLLRTEAVSVKVTGTEFDIEEYPGKGVSTLVLYEGRLEVAAGKERHDIEAGTKVTFDHINDKFNLELIDNLNKTPKWIIAQLTFKEKNLHEIFDVLSWYYMTDFELDDAIDRTTIYSIALEGNEKLTDVLYMLKAISEDAFTYEITAGKILIRAAK